MSMMMGLVALALLGAEAPPPGAGPAVAYGIKVVEMKGPEWRGEFYHQLNPVARQGTAAVFTTDPETADALCKAAGNVTASPRVVAAPGAPATVQCATTRHYVAHVKRIADGPPFEATRLAFQPEVVGLPDGFQAEVSGTPLDQGVLARVAIDDSRFIAFTAVSIKDGVNSPKSGKTGLNAQIQVPEVAASRVEGEWLIPKDGVLVVGLGLHTARTEKGGTVTTERVALIEARAAAPATSPHASALPHDPAFRPAAAGPHALPPTPIAASPLRRPEPTPAAAPTPATGPDTFARFFTPDRLAAPAASPHPALAALAPALRVATRPPADAMPSPAPPSRVLPLGIDPEGRVVPLPPLPDDGPAPADASDEPRPAPQTRPQPAPAPADLANGRIAGDVRIVQLTPAPAIIPGGVVGDVIVQRIYRNIGIGRPMPAPVVRPGATVAANACLEVVCCEVAKPKSTVAAETCSDKATCALAVKSGDPSPVHLVIDLPIKRIAGVEGRVRIDVTNRGAQVDAALTKARHAAKAESAAACCEKEAAACCQAKAADCCKEAAAACCSQTDAECCRAKAAACCKDKGASVDGSVRTTAASTPACDLDADCGAVPSKAPACPVPAPAPAKAAGDKTTWELSLPEAIRIGLENSETIRVVATSRPGPDAAATAIAPACAEAKPEACAAEAAALVWSIESKYWSLMQARAHYWASETAVDLGEALLKRERAKCGPDAAIPNVSEAEEQLQRFRLDHTNATANLVACEKRLRHCLGLPPADGRRIVPTTAPRRMRAALDWSASLATLKANQAARPEPGAASISDAHVATHALARAVLEAESCSKSLDTARRLKAAAEARLKAQHAYYQAGQITIDRYLDAINRWANAVAQEANYQSQFDTACAAFEAVRGTLLKARGITVAARMPAPVRAIDPAVARTLYGVAIAPQGKTGSEPDGTSAAKLAFAGKVVAALTACYPPGEEGAPKRIQIYIDGKKAFDIQAPTEARTPDHDAPTAPEADAHTTKGCAVMEGLCDLAKGLRAMSIRPSRANEQLLVFPLGNLMSVRLTLIDGGKHGRVELALAGLLGF